MTTIDRLIDSRWSALTRANPGWHVFLGGATGDGPGWSLSTMSRFGTERREARTPAGAMMGAVRQMEAIQRTSAVLELALRLARGGAA